MISIWLISVLLSCVVPFDSDRDGLLWYADCDDKKIEVGQPGTWYLDYDHDEYGSPHASTRSCSQPEFYVARAGDCDDSNTSVPSEYLPDDDGDGFYNIWCEGGNDCDDSDSTVHPGALELCDGKQNDCSTPWEGRNTESGLVRYFEELESGTLGESCEVASGFEGEGGTGGCEVHNCPVDGFTTLEGLCCMCDLSQPFSAEQLPEDTMWEIRVQESGTGFLGPRLLQFCQGEYPLHLRVTSTTVKEGGIVYIHGNPRSPPTDSVCEANDTSSLAVLQGSGTRPVIAVTDVAFPQHLVIRSLVIRGGSDCAASEVRGAASGIDLQSFVYVLMLDLCIRDHAAIALSSPSNTGGGVHLYGHSLKSKATINQTWIRENCAEFGGGLSVSGRTFLDFGDVTIANNYASALGGGILLSADVDYVGLKADELIISGNTAGQEFGAGMLILGSPTAGANADLTGGAVIGNIGPGIGLVEVVDDQGDAAPVCSSLTLKDVSFDSNTGGVDVEQINLSSTWSAETLGQDLGTVAEAVYKTEGCN